MRVCAFVCFVLAGARTWMDCTQTASSGPAAAASRSAPTATVSTSACVPRVLGPPGIDSSGLIAEEYRPGVINRRRQRGRRRRRRRRRRDRRATD